MRDQVVFTLMCAEAGDFYPRVCGTEGIELLSARKRPICTLKPEFFFFISCMQDSGIAHTSTPRTGSHRNIANLVLIR